MNLYKKLPCICGHLYDEHVTAMAGNLACFVKSSFCTCVHYNANGHNPELENVLCPGCSLVRLEKVDDNYKCISCGLVMTETQVLELVG